MLRKEQPFVQPDQRVLGLILYLGTCLNSTVRSLPKVDLDFGILVAPDPNQTLFTSERVLSTIQAPPCWGQKVGTILEGFLKVVAQPSARREG